MNYKIEHEFKSIDSEKWACFVRQHPDGNFFQTPEFYGFIAKIPGMQPIVIAARCEDGSILGILVGIIQRERGYLKARFSSRLIVHGGPLVIESDTAMTDQLLKSLIKQFRKKCIYIEFRNLHSLKGKERYFLQNRFSYTDYLNFIIDTEKYKQSIQKLNRLRKRLIKKSFENGARVAENITIEQVKKFYFILKDLFDSKVKKPLPDWAFFEQFYYQPEIGRFFLIEHSGEIIGGCMCPIYNNKIIYALYQAGEDGIHKGIFPSTLASWAAIDYALNNGLLQFDFLGAGKPDEDYGVREFKSSFGGDMVNYGRFTRINNRVLYFIGKTGLAVLSKIK